MMYVHFVHSTLGNEDGGVQLVYESTVCLAWGVIFDRRRDRGVVCVFSICNASGSVCECGCVYNYMPGPRTRMDNHYREMELSKKAGVLGRPRAIADYIYSEKDKTKGRIKKI